MVEYRYDASIKNTKLITRIEINPRIELPSKNSSKSIPNNNPKAAENLGQNSRKAKGQKSHQKTYFQAVNDWLDYS